MGYIVCGALILDRTSSGQAGNKIPPVRRYFPWEFVFVASYPLGVVCIGGGHRATDIRAVKSRR